MSLTRVLVARTHAARMARFVPAVTTLPRSFATTSRTGRRGRKPAKGSKPAGGKTAKQETNVSDVISKAQSNEELNMIVDAVDNQVGTETGVTSALPINIGGSHQPYVEFAYERAMQMNKSAPASALQKIASQFDSFRAIVKDADYAISRFFTEPDYLPKETQQALNLILTDDVSLKKLDAIKDDELREYFLVDDEGMKLWSDVRAAVKGLKLTKDTKDILQSMADDGNLHFVDKVSGSFGDILQAVSTVAKVRIESAIELNTSQKKDIQSAISNFLPEGKKETDVEFVVDSDVIGGLVVNIDDKTIDLSSASIIMALGEAVSSGASSDVRA